MNAIQEYAHYQLSATIHNGKVKLAATSVTEAHKDKVLKTWQKLGAKDIVCVPVEQPKTLPTWYVEYQTSGRFGYGRATIVASSKELVKEQIQKLVKGKRHRITKCEKVGNA